MLLLLIPAVVPAVTHFASTSTCIQTCIHQRSSFRTAVDLTKRVSRLTLEKYIRRSVYFTPTFLS